MYKPKGSFNNSRSEFEQKLNMLVERIRSKTIKFTAKSTKTMNSLTKVRTLPNGRIDLNTVNEMARLTANSVGHFEQNKARDEEE